MARFRRPGDITIVSSAVTADEAETTDDGTKTFLWLMGVN
jgi:hypothetical protein